MCAITTTDKHASASMQGKKIFNLDYEFLNFLKSNNFKVLPIKMQLIQTKHLIHLNCHTLLTLHQTILRQRYLNNNHYKVNLKLQSLKLPNLQVGNNLHRFLISLIVLQVNLGQHQKRLADQFQWNWLKTVLPITVLEALNLRDFRNWVKNFDNFIFFTNIYYRI